MKNVALAITFLVIAVIACNTSKKSDNNTTSIEDSIWELTQLEGTAVNQTSVPDKRIHFSLNGAEKSIHGYSGCNIFNGNYTVENGDRIKFSKLSSTRMACPDADMNESKFLKVFELTDNYTINGDRLMLNVGKSAPLAVFEAVYFD